MGITVIVPCFNRPTDLTLVLGDLAQIGAEVSEAGGAGEAKGRFRVLVIDNASSAPLSVLGAPAGLDVAFIRLTENTGGSGGYNAGLARAVAEAALSEQPADYFWLVDSDARVTAGTLWPLVEALRSDPSIAAAGSAVADPQTGQVFEVGGRVDRQRGWFEPVHHGAAGVPRIVECEYVAACSMLVRREAVERAGLMPDVFLNGDDVEWSIRLARATGGRVVAVTDSVVVHPTFDRFPTWTRYYLARNGFGPIDALGLGPRVRFRRAMREVLRGMGQAMMGRMDLARLQIRGLADAARSRRVGPARARKPDQPALPFEPFAPTSTLAGALAPVLAPLGRKGRLFVQQPLGIPLAEALELEKQLVAAGAASRGLEPVPARALWKRFLLGPGADVAVVPARGRPSSWLAGRTVVQMVAGGFVIRRPRRPVLLAQALWTGIRGLWWSVRVAARSPRRIPGLIPPVSGVSVNWPRLGVVVVSYNRWAALQVTLAHLTGPLGIEPELIAVVDNGSTDGTPEMMGIEYPAVQLLRSSTNVGVAAFNHGVEHLCTGPEAPEAVLILDDDARPELAAVRAAMDLLARRPDVGAVTFHPKHPASGRSEWPFARGAHPERGDDWWPVMGSGNLVRTWAWKRVGGYEEGYFLYRNDTDLALKLLSAGIPVHFHPEWVVHHDSPAAASKSVRWHRMATRNWIWTMRRHGRGVWRIGAIAMGWAWAHKLAGLSVRRHIATARGAWGGLAARPPARPPAGPAGLSESGEDVRRLLTLRFRKRSVR